MNARRWSIGALMTLLATVPSAQASTDGLSVEVATDRGHDAVYEVGDPLTIQARTSEDAYLLVYEIDAEGYVHLLYPDRHSSSFVVGERRYDIPSSDSNLELVAQGPTGQGYIVAIAAEDQFGDLPWYLRPYDAQAQEMGYDGEPNEEQGITAEGRIVGDPFVAMERIRRSVLATPEDPSTFATSYTTYYVGHEVQYPRYLCYDCHRPGYWSWWAGFDPYYDHCSAFNFRVNFAWGWGPSYWAGYVPYYMFVYRNDCPPRYRGYGGNHYSSWDGWRRWRDLWGGPLRRYKNDPVPKTAYNPQRWPKGAVPPGYLAGKGRTFTGRITPDPVARNDGNQRQNRATWGSGLVLRERRNPGMGLRDPRASVDQGGGRRQRDGGGDPIRRGDARPWSRGYDGRPPSRRISDMPSGLPFQSPGRGVRTYEPPVTAPVPQFNAPPSAPGRPAPAPGQVQRVPTDGMRWNPQRLESRRRE